METIVMIIIIAFVFLSVFVVEQILYHKPITEEKVLRHQKEFDALSLKQKQEFNLNFQYDARTELLKERRTVKGFVLILAGVILALGLFVLVFADVPSLRVVFTDITGALILIIYGLFKMASSKQAKLILIAIFVTGALILFLFGKFIALL
jgi:hypothetical protein